jgi:tetratricopeptide (TPR) repeat protein
MTSANGTPPQGPALRGAPEGTPASAVERWLPIVIVVAALAAYHNSFAGAFVFDDEPHLINNPQIRAAWPFADSTTFPNRALVVFSLAVNYALDGLDVWGYHAFNLAVHMLAALTLYGIVRRTLLLEPQRSRYCQSAPWLAAAVALLWVVHPLQTESVTYIIQRAESLMGLWYLLTLYCVIRGAGTAPGTWWYIAAVASCGLGMLSKEVMCTAPVLVLLYDRVFLAPSFGQVFRQRWALYLGLAATWVALAGPVLSMTGPSLARDASTQVGFGVQKMTPLAYALSQPGVIIHYLRLALWPQPLCLDYDWPPASSASAIVLPGLALGALLLATLWACRRRPALAYCGAWFLLILAPTSSIVPILDLAVEHRMYLSLAAVLVLMVLGTYALLEMAARRFGLGEATLVGLAGGGFLAYLVLLGALTIRRNEDYRSPLAMWAAVVAERPNNARGHNNLAMCLKNQGQLNDAEKECRIAIQLEPAYVLAHNNLGTCLQSEGELQEAEQEYRIALQIRPDYAEARANLGACLQGQGRIEEAEEECRRAIQLNPLLAVGHCNLGACLQAQGKMGEAEKEYRIVLRIQPGHAQAHCNLGIIALKRENIKEAEQQFRQALRSAPALAEGHYNLGLCLAALGKQEEATRHFRAAEQINPSFRPPRFADPGPENPPGRPARP